MSPCALLFVCLSVLALVQGKVPKATSEVWLRVDFDFSGTEATEDGYTATDTINSYLGSKQLKWLRYNKVLISPDSAPAPMRVAHMSFQNISQWAAFEQEHLTRTYALHDYFFIHSRRTVMRKLLDFHDFPIRDGTEQNPGGWVYMLKYSVATDSKADVSKQWNRLAPFFVKETKKSVGFLHRQEFTTGELSMSEQFVAMYEFTDLPAMEALMFGKTFTSIVGTLKPLCTHWTTTILSPGDHSGMYFSGAGMGEKTA